MAGTFRADRHGPVTGESPPVSVADRRRTLDGLAGEARRVAARLLDEYADFDQVSLSLVRAFAQSCGRLSTLHTDTGVDIKAVHRELRIAIQLARTLRVEPPR